MSSKTNSIQNNVKQFSNQTIQTNQNRDNLWKKMDSTKITLKDSNRDLYLENDIIVKGTIQNPSDVHLKTKIEPISEEDVKSLSSLNPIKYEYIGDKYKREHYGLIAQEVEPIYPHLVRDDLFYNYKSVNYIEMIPVLIAKINVLEKEIEELKSSRAN